MAPIDIPGWDFLLFMFPFFTFIALPLGECSLLLKASLSVLLSYYQPYQVFDK
ncbi:hypothetical protein HanPSC8_Chr01g0023211 [Helianthus annuus]|nr:hypothetical protein HanPSC8_Chr01g0023211 [Helianthus annuus]